MATTIAAGNWFADAATVWDTGVAPESGTADEAANINHAVVADADLTIGSSGVAGTQDVTIDYNAGGKLTIQSGVKFTQRCRVRLSGAYNNNPEALVFEAGSTHEFDASQAASPSTTVYDLQWNPVNSEYGKVLYSGTQGSPCTVTSNAGGANGKLEAMNSGGGCMEVTYTNFTNIGSASDSAIRITENNSPLFRCSITNSTFTNCGKFEAYGSVSAGGSLELDNVAWSGTTDDTETTLINGSTGAQTGGIRSITECIFDKRMTLSNAQDFIVDNNYFGDKPSIGSNNQMASFTGNFILWPADASGTGMIIGSSASDCILFHAHTALPENPHFFGPLSPGADLDFNRIIFGSDHDGSAGGDCISNPNVGAGFTTTATHCITLPTASNQKLASIMSLQGGATTTAAWNHCTCWANGSYAGETYDGHAGMITDGSSNITYAPDVSGGERYHAYYIGLGTIDDIVPASALTHNCGWNLATGSNGYGYDGLYFSSGSPGANDIVEDPGFVDPTRTVATFDTSSSGLNNPVATAWSTGQSVSPGEVRSHSVWNLYGGVAINYRCKVGHTTDDSDTDDNGAPYECTNWRTNWEFQSVYRLREDLSRIAQMHTWITGGFAPTNPALAGAGADGEDIGAVPVVAVTSSITASNIDGSDTESFSWTEITP